MSLIANWSYPTAIRFGAGRISEIADACLVSGIKNPLLITDRGLAGMEITQKTLDLLDEAGLGRAIFADVIIVIGKLLSKPIFFFINFFLFILLD